MIFSYRTPKNYKATTKTSRLIIAYRSEDFPSVNISFVMVGE